MMQRNPDEIITESITLKSMWRIIWRKSASWKENEQLVSRLHRLQADFDNYRKRTANEKKEWFTQAVCDLVSELLPVLDNMERAIEAKGSAEALAEGVQMVYRQFLSVLENRSGSY